MLLLWSDWYNLPQVPEVMDAVYLQSKLATLTKHVTVWERKNQIAEVRLSDLL